jgi:hypothetical protein
MESVDWYDNISILFLMQPYLYKREFALLPIKNTEGNAVRFMKAHNMQGIQYVLKNLHIKEKPKNLYSSVAVYKNGIPNQTMNLQKRDNTQWKKDHWNHIESYDFFLDIDASESMEEAIVNAKNIVAYFDDLYIPFRLRFSGNGFHIIIPEHAFPKKQSYDPYDDNSIYSKYRSIALFLMDNIAPLIDSTIYDSMRLIKIPYTVAMYQDGEYICTPITREELNNFNRENYTPESMEARIKMPDDSIHNPDADAERLVKAAKVQW